MPAQLNDYLSLNRGGTPGQGASGAYGVDTVESVLGLLPYNMHKRSSTSTDLAGPRLTIPWDVQEGVSGSLITWDAANPTRLTVQEDGFYRIGGFLTHQTSQQRGQTAAEFAFNGVLEGIFRSSSYLRNAGTAWDYWSLEIAPEPYQLSAGDYVEVDLARVSGAGANYETGASGNITFRGVSSKFWIEKC